MEEQLIKRSEWNDFVLEANGSFLQSFEWGEFQESFGRKVFRFFDATEGYGAQFIEYDLPFGKKYWYCPRGPINSKLKTQNSKPQFKTQNLVEKIKSVIDRDVIFFRIGPEISIDQLDDLSAEQSGFKKLSYDIEPSQTLILDITKSEEELLGQMHEKTRYNIKLAERKGVEIKNISIANQEFEKYFDEFYRLMSQTAKRQGIRIFSKEYYRKQLTVNSQQFQGQLFIADYQDKKIAANIVVIFGNKATYLHGGSDNEARALMAPHLLQWEQIKYAKKQGCEFYDFWGYDEEKWPGVSRFKKGFGGEITEYIGCWDYALNKKWYYLYRGVQKIRR